MKNLFNKRHSSLFVLCLAYAITGIIGILAGTPLLLQARNTNVSLEMIGWTLTSSSVGYTLGAISFGRLTNRFQPKYMLSIAILGLAISSIVIMQTTSYSTLLFARFAMGLLLSLFNISLNVIVAQFFAEKLSAAFNTIHSAFAIGALTAPLLFSFTVEITHNVMQAFYIGIGLAVIAALCLLRLPAQQVKRVVATTQENTVKTTSKKTLGQVFLWILVLQVFLYVGIEGGFGGWIVTAISKNAQVSLSIAAPATTMFWLGLTIGRIAGTQAHKYPCITEHRILAIGFIGTSLACAVAAFFTWHVAICFIATLTMGIFMGPIFPSIMALASRTYADTLSLISSMLLFSSGAAGFVFPALVGTLMSSKGVTISLLLPALLSVMAMVPCYLANKTQGWQIIEAGNTIEGEQIATQM